MPNARFRLSEELYLLFIDHSPEHDHQHFLMTTQHVFEHVHSLTHIQRIRATDQPSECIVELLNDIAS